MINWKVRFKNGSWVIAFLSQIMIVLQIALTGLNALGVIDYQLTEDVKEGVLSFANAIFVLLSMLGLVQDPTTKGIGDSEKALTYKDPN
jgi:phi LC3 family holin